MIPSNPAENKQSHSPRALAHVDSGQAHAAIAAALCALAIIFVLLTSQWIPLIGASTMSTGGEADMGIHVDTAAPFVLRF